MSLYNENSLYSDASYSEWDHPEYFTLFTATTRHLADSSSNANNETTNIFDNATSLINSSFTFQTRVFDTVSISRDSLLIKYVLLISMLFSSLTLPVNGTQVSICKRNIPSPVACVSIV